ncbi:hypothetical protein TNCV_2357471 [Trichonephila clavipes]|nr:hypothetical protein TNCV_2357471 [Trichonephila clavipes]
MATVDFLHYGNPPTSAGVEPTTLGAEGQRQTNHAAQTNLTSSYLRHNRDNAVITRSLEFRMIVKQDKLELCIILYTF